MKTVGVVLGGLILTATAGGVYLWRRRRKIAAAAEQQASDAAAAFLHDVAVALPDIKTGSRDFLQRNQAQIQNVFRDGLDRSKATTMTAVPAVERAVRYNAPVYQTYDAPVQTNQQQACRALRLELRKIPTGVAWDVAQYRMSVLGC